MRMWAEGLWLEPGVQRFYLHHAVPRGAPGSDDSLQGRFPSRCSEQVSRMVLHGRHHPAAEAVFAPLYMYASDWWPATDTIRHTASRSIFGFLCAACSAPSRPVRRRPISAMLYSLPRIGWSMESATTLTDSRGCSISLLLFSPAALKTRILGGPAHKCRTHWRAMFRIRW